MVIATPRSESLTGYLQGSLCAVSELIVGASGFIDERIIQFYHIESCEGSSAHNTVNENDTDAEDIFYAPFCRRFEDLITSSHARKDDAMKHTAIA